MSQRAVKRDTTPVDPMFFIPDGVDELYYTDHQLIQSSDETEESEDTEPFFDDTDVQVDYGDETDYSDAPETPQILGIVSQTIRVNSTGNEVVDVVFEVDEVYGSTNYEFRVVKI